MKDETWITLGAIFGALVLFLQKKNPDASGGSASSSGSVGSVVPSSPGAYSPTPYTLPSGSIPGQQGQGGCPAGMYWDSSSKYVQGCVPLSSVVPAKPQTSNPLPPGSSPGGAPNQWGVTPGGGTYTSPSGAYVSDPYDMS
jgi:hypothetical protein